MRSIDMIDSSVTATESSHRMRSFVVLLWLSAGAWLGALALTTEAAEQNARQFATLLGEAKFADAAALMAAGDASPEQFVKEYWQQVTKVTGALKSIKRAELKGKEDQRKVKLAIEFVNGKYDMIVEFREDKITKFTVPGLYK
jgi:hypothetical protein